MARAVIPNVHAKLNPHWTHGDIRPKTVHAMFTAWHCEDHMARGVDTEVVMPCGVLKFIGLSYCPAPPASETMTANDVPTALPIALVPSKIANEIQVTTYLMVAAATVRTLGCVYHLLIPANFL
jgi:hypothetical protein